MSLEEYVIRKLEGRIARLEQENKDLRVQIEAMEDWAVHIDYLKSVIEKAHPAATEENLWDGIFT